MKIAKTLTAIAAVAVATAAFAAVTFDSASGTGFVGKGDVQLVTGWNNQMLQSNANSVMFVAETTDNYTAVCTFTTGEGTRGETTHNVPHSKSTGVNSSVSKALRQNNQGDVTGFNLSGWGPEVTTSGTVPVAGTPCNGNPGHGGTWSSVTKTSSTGSLLIVGYATPLYTWN